MSRFSFRPQVESLDGRCLPSGNPAVSINDVAVAEGNSDSGYVVLTASLSAPSTKTVKVGYKTANGTAVAGSDYDAVSGTLTFAPGQTRTTVGVLVHGDTQAEPDESFSVRLTNARNATIADGTGVVTLLDDGDAKPSISISDAAAVEGGYLTFTVSLSMPFTQPVTVEWGNQGTLTFAPGETAKSISVWAGPDDGYFSSPYYEPGQEVVARLVYVGLFNASANARILDGEGIGTVYEASPVPSWYPTTYVDPNQVSWLL